MRRWRWLAFVVVPWLVCSVEAEVKTQGASSQQTSYHPSHQETPTRATPRWQTAQERATSPARVWERGDYRSVQVNVTFIDGVPHNVEGDAANEPTIAVDLTHRLRMSIGWRQFDTVESDFRQSGWATSHDGGASWPYSGTLTAGTFGTDPVLASDGVGNFYFASVNGEHLRLFRSFDGGLTWEGPFTVLAGFHDKPWMAIDFPSGNIYVTWNEELHFTRSIDGGTTFMSPINTGLGRLLTSTIAVDPNGIVYVVDEAHRVARSVNAQFPIAHPTFETIADVDLGGSVTGADGPNPKGLLGQTTLAADLSSGPTRGNLYMLGSVRPSIGTDPMEVMFARSTDGGFTWEPPKRINDDPVDNGAWQWFGTMSVAPNGRIDVIWNDTRASGQVNMCELTYTYSNDGGETWSDNVPVSPPFDSLLGWPRQDKLGDYYHMVSDDGGVDVAYAATFNGEQDVFYLRIDERKKD